MKNLAKEETCLMSFATVRTLIEHTGEDNRSHSSSSPDIHDSMQSSSNITPALTNRIIPSVKNLTIADKFIDIEADNISPIRERPFKATLSVMNFVKGKKEPKTSPARPDLLNQVNMQS